MKKILLGTTALVAASMVAGTAAQAAEPVKLGLGGFMVQTFSYQDQDGDFETANSADYSNWDQKSTTEVHFKGSTKLDNGIGVAVQIEMQADGGTSNNGSMDEVYMRLTSDSMGELRLGRDDGAVTLMAHRAPTGGVITVNSGEVQPDAFVQPAGSANTFDMTTEGSETNHNKVTYLSPTYMGFSVGASFVPDDTADTRANLPNNASSAWEASLAYNETIAGVKVGADVGYMTRGDGNGDTDNNGLDSWRGGLNLGYAGFTLGGSYQRLDVDGTAGVYASASQDGAAWDLGLNYATGPYKVGVTYFTSEVEGTVSGNSDKDDDMSWLVVGGTYTLGPGVSLTGDLIFADYDDELTGNANENSGFAVNAGVVVAF